MSRKHKRGAMPGVKWRIFALFALFTVLIIAILWVFQTVFLDEFYVNIKIRNMRLGADAAENYENADLKELCERYDISIRVLDEKNSEITSAQGLYGGNIFALSPKLISYVREIAQNSDGEILLEVGGAEYIPHDQNIPRRMIFARISEDGEIILVESVISTLGGTVETLRIQLYWATGVFLLIGMVFAVFVSRSLSKPIEKLNESAKKLAAGDYGADFSVKGDREVNELSHTLSYAAKELSKVEELRRELIANVSHDLRTPLTMITAYSEAMRDIPGELTSENVQIIIDETNHLTELVNDLLDLSRIQSGAHMLNKSRFDLTKSIDVLLKRYGKLTEQDGFKVVFEHGKDVYVTADENKITQVAYNLINNAVNYAGEDRRVLIRQTLEGDKVRIEVTDHGEGIPQEQLEYIWDRYYRAGSPHKRSKQGTGIGLSIVKGIMELHNERYGVSSTPGEGSTFWFELTVDAE